MRIQLTLILLALTAACHSATQGPKTGSQSPAPEPVIALAPTAEQISAEVAKAYRSFSTYQDEGVVETTYIRESLPDRVEKKPFSTAFARPGQFRFQFRNMDGHSSDDRYIVWRSGNSVKTWWGMLGREESPQSLENGLAGATGVSGGSAYTVPMMLIADELKDPWSHASLPRTQRIKDGELAGTSCFRLQRLRNQKAKDTKMGDRTIAIPAASTKEVYWFDQKTLLLLRIENETVFDTFQTKEVTTYTPKVNQPITESAFTFKP